jgi:hypothetical protein
MVRGRSDEINRLGYRGALVIGASGLCRKDTSRDAGTVDAIGFSATRRRAARGPKASHRLGLAVLDLLGRETNVDGAERHDVTGWRHVADHQAQPAKTQARPSDYGGQSPHQQPSGMTTPPGLHFSCCWAVGYAALT